MGKTYIHKFRGKFRNGIDENIPRCLQNYFDRKNYDIGIYRKISKMRKAIGKVLDANDDLQNNVIKKMVDDVKSKISKRYV